MNYKVIVPNRNYYFQHDPFNGYMPTESVYPSTGLVIDDAYAKKAFFIAVNDAKKRTLPLNATLETKSVFEDGEYVDNLVVSEGYFGMHMIHKLFYFKGISWSCTNGIIKYNDNDRTNYKIKGFVAGLIYNGIADKGSDGKLEFKWGLDEQGNRINYYGITDNNEDREFVIESDGNDDEIIAGEELAARDEHHGEARREDRAADKARGRARERGGADAGRQTADGDEHAGEDRQHKHAPERELCLGLAGV